MHFREEIQVQKLKQNSKVKYYVINLSTLWKKIIPTLIHEDNS